MKTAKALTVARWLPLLLLLALSGNSAAASDLSALKNLRQPSNQLYVSGQPLPSQFALLTEAGVQHIISFRQPEEMAGFDEGAAVAAAGMRFYSIPVAPRREGFTRAKVAQFDALLKEIGADKVLIHCATGQRPASMMALRAHWLQGKNAEQALAIGEASGLQSFEGIVKQLLEP